MYNIASDSTVEDLANLVVDELIKAIIGTFAGSASVSSDDLQYSFISLSLPYPLNKV